MFRLVTVCGLATSSSLLLLRPQLPSSIILIASKLYFLSVSNSIMALICNLAAGAGIICHVTSLSSRRLRQSKTTDRPSSKRSLLKEEQQLLAFAIQIIWYSRSRGSALQQKQYFVPRREFDGLPHVFADYFSIFCSVRHQLLFK